MRALYKLAPEAKIETALATYEDSWHFEQTHAATYYVGRKRLGVDVMVGIECECEA